MKNYSKLFAVVLCLSMLLSCIPGMAFTAKAAEADITKPTGISIVENYDAYVGSDWVSALALPETVSVGGVDTPVEWEDAAQYVNPEKTGWYSVPGTVNGVKNAVSITIQVREYQNLLAEHDYGFENTRKWTANGDNVKYVQSPKKEGNYALELTIRSNISSSVDAIYSYDSIGTAVFKSMKEIGAGDYYLGIWSQVGVDSDTDSVNDTMTGFVKMYMNTQANVNGSNLVQMGDTAKKPVALNGNTYVRVGGVIPVTENHLNTYTWVKLYASVKGTAIGNTKLYFDMAELIPLKMVLSDVPEMIVKGATVDLENSLDMNFYIDQAQLTEGETYTAEIVHTYADGSEDVKNITVDTANVDSTGYCYVTYQNIAAKEMGDLITVTFSDSQGNAIAVWQDSVKQYVERLMADNAANAKLQTLCVDLLNYGAAAQQAFSYNLNALVNADLGGKVGTTDVTATNTATGTAQWEGTTLTLESNITMELFFAKDALTEGAIATVSYTDHTGANVSKDVEVKLDAYYDMWSVKVEDLVLADTNTAVTVTIGEITATDSMASYVARSQVDNTDVIYNAILAVGASARAYFNS